MDYDAVTAYFRKIFADLGVTNGRLLDFGCGIGEHMRSYARAGFDAYGCDVVKLSDDQRIKLIGTPYRIPYEDSYFDLAVSTGVLEHAQNTETVFRELRRVLKPGGIAVHLFPTRFYLPSEPHIYVPFVNWLWPHVPRWYLKVWARVVRNAHQRDMSADEVADANDAFCRDGIHYARCGYYERLSNATFGNYRWAMDLMFKHSEGRFAALARSTPFLPWPLIGRHFRMALLVQVKAQQTCPDTPAP